MSRINNPVRLKTLPLLALRGLVVFPGNLIHFDVGRTPSLNVSVSVAMAIYEILRQKNFFK